VTGRLVVCPTPIGNLEDITLRALRVLAAVDALACEDTRRTRALLTHHGIKTPSTLFSLHEHNEARALGGVLALLDRGVDVALCSDAGVPLVNDPGYPTVREVIGRGHPVEAVPGPSAVLAALIVSGLPVSSFTFKGFPPRKPGPRKRFLEVDRQSPHTLIFYESPYRVAALLKDALEVYGDREAAVANDLTKLFEKVERGPISALLECEIVKKPKGEYIVVIAGLDRRSRAAEAGDQNDSPEE
jgi:16S rRNA (cytidine1402-2'-O)-methyltransferase